MKILLISFISFSLLMSGCNNPKTTEENGEKDIEERTTDEMDQEREEFVMTIEERIESLEAELERLKNDLEMKAGEERTELNQDIDQLEQDLKELRDDLEATREHTEDEWSEAKRNIKTSLERIENEIRSWEIKVEKDAPETE